MMEPINLRSFKQKVVRNKKGMRAFLTRLSKKPPKDLNDIIDAADKQVWEQTDCLSCGNCCKKMTPTFTVQDIKRISAHFELTPVAFKEKYLKYEKSDKDWQNKKQPCQWIDPKDNKCSIYSIRPADCAGFPHLTKKKVVDYMHVHQQNIAYCPATFKWVELIQEAVSAKK
jgi:uncharacterized protein